MVRRKKLVKSNIWGGRFTDSTSKEMLNFNSSIHFDKKLYLQDIEGSLAHAEMLALMLAQKKVGHFDLGAKGLPNHRLVTSGRMCAMCLGNVCWSGIKEVFSSAEPEDVENITGFDEGPTPPDYIDQLEKRGIRIVSEVQRSKGQKVLRLYMKLGGKIYNATR